MTTLGWGAALCLTSLSCRDEQAGPARRPAQLRTASARGITQLKAPPAALTFRSGATFGAGALRYLGSDVAPPSARPGEAVVLTHYFEVLKAPPEGFKFFVHLIHPGTGQLLVNADHEPQDGAAPVEAWPVGAVVPDRHTIVVPEQLPARVVLGFWREELRLPVDQPGAHDGSNRALGPLLEGGVIAPPELTAVRAAEPPRIDGALSDAVWRKAKPVTLGRSIDGAPTALKTTALIAYDARHLYVAFDCEDPDIWGTLQAHDDPIYNQEVVEVFIDADGDGRTYNELQVAPTNVTFDAAFVERRLDLEGAMKWESGMQSAVGLRGTLNNPDDSDQGWTAELRIPLEKLSAVPRLPPQPGDRWRINLYRLEHLNGRRAVEGQSFSPVHAPDFHNLPRFGWLIFE